MPAGQVAGGSANASDANKIGDAKSMTVEFSFISFILREGFVISCYEQERNFMIRVDSTITFEGIQWKNEGEATVHSKLLVTTVEEQ